MYAYEVSPIDMWAGWMTEADYLAALKVEDIMWDMMKGQEKFDKRKAKALALEKRLGWEGDFAVEPSYAAIPGKGGDSYSEVLIAWKQSNNGSTFVFSPYQLPWLSDAVRMISG